MVQETGGIGAIAIDRPEKHTVRTSKDTEKLNSKDVPPVTRQEQQCSRSVPECLRIGCV